MIFQGYRPRISVLTIAFLCAITFTTYPQRGGSAAQGGSPRPEARQIEQPSDSGGTPLTTAAAGEVCDPATVDGTCPGTFSFSYGFNFNTRPRAGGSSTIRAGFAFATYVHKRIFLEIDSDNFLSAQPSVGNRVSGYGDTTLYAGADVLLGTKKNEPFLTVLYGIKIPTASETKGLGSGKVDHTVLAAIGKVVGKNQRTQLELDIGNTFGGRSSGSGFDNFPFASAILRQKLDSQKRFTLHVEAGGTFKTSNYIGDAYNLTYLESKINDTFSLKTGGKFGITNNVTRAGLYIGFKFNGNLKKLF